MTRMDDMKRNSGVLAANLAKLFQENKGEYPYSHYTKFLLGILNRSDFSDRDMIIKERDNPPPPDEQKFIEQSKEIFESVLIETCNKTIEKAPLKCPESNDLIPQNVVPAEKINIPEGKDRKEYQNALTAILEKLRGEPLVDYEYLSEKDILLEFIDKNFVKEKNPSYMDVYNRTDTISIDNSRSEFNRTIDCRFKLIASQIRDLTYNVTSSSIYTGSITDFSDINSKEKEDDRRSLFEDLYKDIKIEIGNGDKDEDYKENSNADIFPYLEVKKYPKDHRPGKLSLITVTIKLDEMLQNYKKNAVPVHYVIRQTRSPITGNALTLVFRTQHFVKTFMYETILEDTSPEYWSVKVYPFYPYYKLTDPKSDLNVDRKGHAPGTYDYVNMLDWVMPGFGVTSSVEFKNDLVGIAAKYGKLHASEHNT